MRAAPDRYSSSHRFAWRYQGAFKARIAIENTAAPVTSSHLQVGDHGAAGIQSSRDKKKYRFSRSITNIPPNACGGSAKYSSSTAAENTAGAFDTRHATQATAAPARNSANAAPIH